MNDFIYNNFTHFLCLMVLISRLGDILSTYLISPTLKLEGNPIAKKLGWIFILLSLVMCVAPYYYTPLAVIIVIPSLLVAASNMGKFWVVKAMGETEFLKYQLMIASKSRLSYALFSVMTSSLLVLLVGIFVLILCPDSQNWGRWVAWGLIVYAFVIALYGSLSCRKLFRRAQEELLNKVN